MGKRKAPYHHPALGSALMEAAAAELREFGVKGFSLRRIARRLGVSHAAPYRHFRNRDALLAALVWETHKALNAALRAAREQEKRGPKERLLSVGLAYLEYARQHPDRLSLVFSEPGLAAVPRHPVKPTPEESQSHDSFRVLEDTVRECQLDGVLDPEGSSRALSILLWSMVHGLSTIEREGVLEAMGRDRKHTAEETRAAVIAALDTLVSRNARPVRARNPKPAAPDTPL